MGVIELPYLQPILAGKTGYLNGAKLEHGLIIPGDLSIHFQEYPKQLDLYDLRFF